MTRVRRFWQERPLLSVVFEYALPLLLITSILVNELAPRYSALPFAAFVVLFGVGEYVPLSKMPMSTMNAVSHSSTKYTGAMGAITRLILVAIFFGFLLELIHPTDAESSSRKSFPCWLWPRPSSGWHTLSCFDLEKR